MWIFPQECAFFPSLRSPSLDSYDTDPSSGCRSGWEASFWVCQLPELLRSPWHAHTPLLQHRMGTWHPLPVPHLLWLMWNTSVHYWPSRGFQMRNTLQPYLSEWFLQESLGRFFDHLLPSTRRFHKLSLLWKELVLLSPAFLIYPNGKGHKSGLVCSNQFHPTPGKFPTEPGGGSSTFFVLGSHDGMAGAGEWWQWKKKSRTHTSVSWVLAICAYLVCWSISHTCTLHSTGQMATILIMVIDSLWLWTRF